MTLTQLIHEVWKDEEVRKLEVKLRKDEVKVVVNATLKHIGKGLVKYGKVKLKGLFTLEVREVKGRKIHDFKTGGETYSKDYKKIGIETSKNLKEELKKL
ncbi:HU family DNA-binding protein [Priestia megaterium]|uniref:HU family DNA-binding protein n=1 Tax=Priestia megaterium TaxID=1404 RepID=UPI0015D48D32|nr:HU family DNA-binding protein [Priestia megaterium]